LIYIKSKYIVCGQSLRPFLEKWWGFGFNCLSYCEDNE